MAKRKGALRQFFGVSQEEMATLLKISPAQWSMFESGRRDLPKEGRKSYNEMMLYVLAAKNKEPKKELTPLPPGKLEILHLKSLLLANQTRQGITERKIARIQKKQIMAETALNLEGFGENSIVQQEQFVTDKIKEILDRSKIDVHLNKSAEMMVLQIKLKVLKYEEPLLKAALEDLL